MVSLRPAQLIPRRIMTVTSVMANSIQPDGSVKFVKVGWKAKCLKCGAAQVYMLHQYHKAVEFTREHDCYAKGKKTT